MIRGEAKLALLELRFQYTPPEVLIDLKDAAQHIGCGLQVTLLWLVHSHNKL